MPIFILVRQLVLLVCINSALIMSPPARTVNKTPLKHLLLNSFGGVKMCDKIAISAHILKIVKNDPFLRLQMTAKEVFNRHQFFLYK